MGGQRRSDLIEAERNYTLVKREKQESGKFIKEILRLLFSQIGVIVLAVVVAIFGKAYFTNFISQLYKTVNECFHTKGTIFL